MNNLHDLKVEQCLLECFAQNGHVARAKELIATINPDLFEGENNKLIFKAILALVQDGSVIDESLLSKKLEVQGYLSKVGGISQLVGLFITSRIVEFADEYIKILKDFYKRRKTLEILSRSSIDITHADLEPDIVLNNLHKRLFDLASSDIDNMPKNGYQALDLMIKELSNKNFMPVSSGFQHLDQLVCMSPGNLILLAARPGMGKTAFTLNLILNLINQKIPTLFFSFEMSTIELMMRYLSIQSGISTYKFRGKNATSFWNSDEFPQIEASMEFMKENSELFFTDDNVSRNLIQLKTISKKYILEKNIKMILIDYLQLIVPTGKFESVHEQLSEISRFLKLMAKELNIPIFCLSQLNREIERRVDAKPRKSDLLGSGSLEMNADIIMFLHKEATQDYLNKDTQLIISKNRNGTEGAINFEFDKSCQRFTEKSKMAQETFVSYYEAKSGVSYDFE